ncbi:MAG TPA: VWA domain-containing protein [Rhizomicrobium sp.]|nr:VWA domain-containing protein [Rhizomicrobium sp.]
MTLADCHAANFVCTLSLRGESHTISAMTFVWIDMLWLLLAAPVLVGGYVILLRRRKKVAMMFPHMAAIRQALDGHFKYKRHIPPALLLLAFCLLVVASARPAAVVTLASQGGTIIMAMDVSGSMRAADVAPNRISAAQAAAKAFVTKRAPQIRIGIVGFSGAAFLVQAPTTDTNALNEAIDNLQPQFTTAIGAAVITSLQTIFPQIKMDTMVPGFGGSQFVSGEALGDSTHPPAKPVPPPTPVPPGSYRSAAIVLMTDGRNTTGPDPVESARVAANLGVRIFTIGFGTAGGQMINFYGRSIRAVLDEDTLKRMAAMTSAQYFHAQSADELTKIYQQLTTKLQKESQETEISAFFVAGALVFSTLSGLLSLLWFGRIF